MGGPPAASPMSTPQNKTGLQAAGMTNLHVAVNMLEQALPAFGAESEQGEAIIKCLSVLRKHVAKKDTSDLVPAEVLQMVSQLPQMGGGSDIQRMITQQMKQPQAPPKAA